MGMSMSKVEKMEAKGDVKGLIKALKHKDQDIRQRAVEALGKIGDARAVESLVQVLRDKNGLVRWAAAAATR
ncbi:unnamed protein product [marine sediment metagenome]|uniref:HEAT repeat domain-containing protein n=1 Tax=marine sediment metagenome TaxID=412755 RepID=X1HVI6_9ZZZZ